MKISEVIVKLETALKEKGDRNITSEGVHYLMYQELKDKGLIIIEGDVFIRERVTDE